MHPPQKPILGKQHPLTPTKSGPKTPEEHHEAPAQEGSGKLRKPVRHDMGEHPEKEKEGHHDEPNKQHVRPTIDTPHEVKHPLPKEEHPEVEGHKSEVEPDTEHEGRSIPEETELHDPHADAHPHKFEDEAPKDPALGDQGPEDNCPQDQDPKAAPGPTQDPDDQAPNARDINTLKAPAPLESQIDASKLEVTTSSSQPGAGDLSETEWATVLRNCAVFYGWIIDPRTNRITRAPKPAFQLRSKVDQKPKSKVPDFVPAVATSLKTNVTHPVGKTMNSNAGNNTQTAPNATYVNTAITATNPKSKQGIPNFRINDDSYIEITAHKDDLTEALTRNDFSGQSTDGSVSAGAYGASVGVSAGHGSNTDNTTSNQHGTKMQTLVARYLFPRCDIILWPDELEPMPELAELIEVIRRTKNIKALRRLHAEYGNFFPQRVTLGGRLISSKVLDEKDTQQMTQQKQSFRTSVGIAVSGNLGIYNAGVSLNHVNTSGDAHKNENSNQTQNEACVFDAVGGQTILATNPKQWCSTVADYKLWRVINREGILPLSEMLSGIPGFEAVPLWFVRAVPALSRYITLDEAHGCKTRFRVMSPLHDLSKINSNGEVSFYLGHDPNNNATPQLTDVITRTCKGPIFQPATYRAPTIIGYENFEVGNTRYGAVYNEEFVLTDWDVIAPFDKELKSGTRVILRSCPVEPSKVDPTPSKGHSNEQSAGGSKESKSMAIKENPSGSPSHMVVFRNAQGEFLPAMSDSSEYQYWRIIKMDAGERHVKPGDNIRLCWDFRDQTTGWRDFTHDVFGRREFSRPADVLNPLFLKVPWPRFDDFRTHTALLMSAERENVTERFVKINVGGKDNVHKYHLEDLQLRIDSIGNGGDGDTADYLLNHVEQAKPPTPRQEGYLMVFRQAVALFGL